MTLSDHELMHRSRLGDPTAFDELVRRWENPIGRVAARLLGDWVRSRRRLPGSLSARPACSRTVTRKAGRSRPGSIEFRKLESGPTSSPSAVNAGAGCPWPIKSYKIPSRRRLCPRLFFDRRELGRQVELALAALPEPRCEGEVLVLKHFGQLSP